MHEITIYFDAVLIAAIVAFHALSDESESLVVVQDLLDAFQPEECEAVATFFGAVVNPKDAILRLEVDGDFCQEFLADAQSCGGAGQGEYVGYGGHGRVPLAGV